MDKITVKYLAVLGIINGACKQDNKSAVIDLDYYITNTDDRYIFKDDKIVSDKLLFSPDLVILHYHNGTEILNKYNINGVIYIPNGYIIKSANIYQEYTPDKNVVTQNEILIYLYRMGGKKGDFKDKQEKIVLLQPKQ